MVALGLVEISGLTFINSGKAGARIDGSYALNFASPHLPPLLLAVGCDSPEAAIDPNDVEVHAFLVELAGALATLRDDEIDQAAGADMTFSAAQALDNVVDFGEWSQDRWKSNPSWQAAERFKAFLPMEASLSPGEKLYLYATLLGRAIHAA